MERRKFAREFKLEAVCLIRNRGVSFNQASQALGVHVSQLRIWVKKFAEDPQHASTLDEQRLIDGLMADAHSLIVREVDGQAPGDLLRAQGVFAQRRSFRRPCRRPYPAAQESRSERQQRQPAVPPHKLAMQCSSQASPSLTGERLPRHAIARLSHDTPDRRFAWRHCAAISREIVEAGRPSRRATSCIE